MTPKDRFLKSHGVKIVLVDTDGDQGGYIPTIDHSVPPDVSLADFQYYLERKRELLEGRR